MKAMQNSKSVKHILVLKMIRSQDNDATIPGPTIVQALQAPGNHGKSRITQILRCCLVTAALVLIAPACLAIDANTSVQDVDRKKLPARLLADGQILVPAPAPSTASSRKIVEPDSLPGIVLDDDQAEYQGSWTVSNRQPSPIGASYRHDDNKGRAERSATFTATIPDAGDYEIRLLFTWHENRSSRTKVTVTGAGEEKTLRINQREPAMKDRVPNALGIFRFEAGAKARLTVSNEGADGYVIVDGLQILPVETAREERAGKRPSGYAAIEMVEQPAPVPAINVPRKPLKPDLPRAAAASDVHGKTYDLIIFGGTPGGIAMAVRAAREGLSVLLVNRNRHLGGILSSGLRVWDTLYEGKRSPIYDEARQGIFDYYRDTYGEHSAQYRRCLPGKSGHTNGLFEPAVAEHILTRMVNAEPRITVLCDFFIADAQRDAALLKTATFRHMVEKQSVTVSGKVFADCSYEGDFAAVAKVPYRVGRESREEFGEPHAGVVYMGRGSPQTDAERRQSEAHKKLNQRPFRGWQTILPGSTGESDSHVQAFNYRTILTDDPANRLPVARPDGYDRDFIAGLEQGSVVEIPNRKFGWNRPQVIGPHDDYVEGDWATRQRVMDEHWQATLGMLYFLQNDESVSPQIRERWKPLGLAADEFPDNGHRPYEIYVREARRIVGRYVFTQHDGSLPTALDRAPVHPDSVGITEWYFDSHACTKRRVPGSLDEGKHMLHEITFPGQVPYRALLPKGLDNLLVPVCLSSTHVAWGTIRLEPTWMNLAESAAYAAGLAVETGVAPSDIDSDALLRRLADARVMITFFNDIDLDADDPRVPAAQYFGTKGFFSSYDARLNEPLTEAVRRAWGEGLTELRESRLDATALARQVRQAEAADSPKVERTRGEAMLSMWRAVGGGKSASTEDGAASPATRQRAPLKVQPVRSSSADEVRGKTYDLVVIGGTPGGIACAVRAAREGLTVLLVQHNRHIGGMLTNGLMQWDALYGGPRSPLFNEYAKSIEDYYRKTYGPGSPQFRQARYTQQHYPMSRFECGVAEYLFNQLVSAEPNITTLLAHYPADIEREGAALKTLTLRKYGTKNDITVTGVTYVDATYEGDLAALAKVPYRVGREARDEYDEPHAGRIFTNISKEAGSQDAKDGKLNLHLYGHSQGTVDPMSPGTADRAVQAYNYRFSLSNEPGNIRLPEKPPGYDREEYVGYYRRNMSAGALNGKATFNSAILPGENHGYPEATWPEREKIIERHKNFALGLMWFLQNDESVRPASREHYRSIGLPLDEFPDNDNIPYEMYVREARRIVGRHVFTEHDNRAAPSLTRPPIHADGIAFTDWAMDSHDCTWDRSPGYAYDGKLILTEESRPAQIPWRSLLPQGVDNLIVPVGLSATHVAWGAVRLEPVWMMTGEAAGLAAALSKRQGTTPGKLNADLLVRSLCEERHFVSFFNDLEADADHPAMPVAQYFATRGFFPDYNARLDEPLSEAVQAAWQTGLQQLRDGTLEPMRLAERVRYAESDSFPVTDQTRGDFLLAQFIRLQHPRCVNE
jgi:2-polyprenyl-6-methoxyphenol hydroxylase-like FAD-dependent oxidoreductase